MEDNIKQEVPAPAEPKQAPVEPKKEKKEAEFSVAWHLKVLAVIYVLLAVFYIILKIVLK
ncbi:MAG: hypothetical protein CVV21_01720 [Candidatus Goldiibacteriota bacterium HGW-Goldbacteria-1]|jgi:hypothetical protein|nr:MAG: hypothetical protein CVV21_01720 [Candidatus Goldiibacteriota bacterium HGW-Goldbacteria-1]